MPILQKDREKEILDLMAEKSGEEFAPYSKYENDLYQEGVVGILISMNTEYLEVYEYYYQQIITEMKEFLLTKGITYDCK